MTPDQITSAAAAYVGGLFAAHDTPAPTASITDVLVLEKRRVRIIVTVAPYDGPAKLFYDESGHACIGTPPANSDATPVSPAPTPNLTPLQQAIVDQLDHDRPTKATVIAMRLGKSCNGSFRSMLADLVRFGVIAKSGHGYLRCG